MTAFHGDSQVMHKCMNEGVCTWVLRSHFVGVSAEEWGTTEVLLG